MNAAHHSQHTIYSIALKIIILTFLVLLTLSNTIAANDPGHDTLYVEQQGNSELNGSLNISFDLQVANRLFSTYLDIIGNGTIGGSANRILGTATDLYIESPGGDIIFNGLVGTSNMVRIGDSSGDNVNLNVTGDIYVDTGGDIQIDGVSVCLADGTNCQAVSGSSSAGGWINTSTVTSTTLNVGIGTANPNNTLSVDGTINTTGNIYESNSRVCTVGNGLCAGSDTQTLQQVTDQGTTTTDAVTIDSDGDETTIIGGNLDVPGTINIGGSSAYRINNTPILSASIAKDNLAIGVGSMNTSIVDDVDNTAIGSYSLAACTSCNDNTAIGLGTLQSTTTGSSNTALGVNTLWQIAGDNNIALGYRAGADQTAGSNNIIIGSNIDLINTTASNQLNIGNIIFSNTIDGTDNTISSGNIGIKTQRPNSTLHVIGNASISGNLYENGNRVCTASNGLCASGGSSAGGWTNNSLQTSTNLNITSNGGNLLLNGTGDNTVPATGAGIRMMWIPGKAALRAGYASSLGWNQNNIGANSTAFGYGTNASGKESMAWGSGTQAQANQDTAWGTSSRASGGQATAWGASSVASNAQDTAWGFSTTASGGQATAWGTGTVASGAYSTTWGNGASATSLADTAWGWGSKASGSVSTAWGWYSSASGQYSTAISNATALGFYSTAIGRRVIANGNASVAIGEFLHAKKNESYIIGTGIDQNNKLNNTKANSLIIGFRSETPTLFINQTHVNVTGQLYYDNSEVCTAGNGLCASASSSGAGWTNDSIETVTTLNITSNGGNLLLNGSGDATTPTSGTGIRMMWIPGKAALRAGQVTGTQWNDNSIGQNSTAFGYNTNASGRSSMAWGETSKANGTSSTAWGSGTTADGPISTAWGNSVRAIGSTTTAWGTSSIASGIGSTAWGSNSFAGGTDSTAWGLYSNASAQYATAWGSAKASGIGSTAWGSQTTANATQSTAWGYGTVAGGAYSTALGYETSTGTGNSIAAGQYLNALRSNTIVLGKGIDNNNRLNASRPNSMVVGFNSETATLFVNQTHVNITGQLYYDNSEVCTASNGLCSSGGSSNSAGGWTNTTTLTSTDLNVNLTEGNLTITAGRLSVGTQIRSSTINVLGSSGITAGTFYSGSSSTDITTDANIIAITNTDTTNGNYIKLGFNDELNGPNSAAIIGHITDHTNNYGDISIVTRSSAGLSEKVKVLSTGEVGIGTIQPNETLTVDGDSRFIGNQTWEIPGSESQVCFERFVGTEQNYTRCINSTGQVIETLGIFPVN